MKLDLRLPIGLMFTIFGAILTLYGFAFGKRFGIGPSSRMR